MYRCEFFGIKELVPPEVYDLASNKTLLWLIFDMDLLKVIDALRRDYGPAIINDWPWDGSNTMCGFRPWKTDDEYAQFSQHRFGRAFDLHFKDVAAEKVRSDIINKKKPYMQRIEAIELEVAWVHIDRRNNNAGKLVTFNPG